MEMGLHGPTDETAVFSGPRLTALTLHRMNGSAGTSRSSKIYPPAIGHQA